ncbi:hypothetical protein [Streptomyces sp. URMC 123]|uniref:hypothetical protein n=1 Tax=Streptomyces sp. URMC 123 TaxID=3423403 RepID=UPI003F534AD0
MIRALALGVVLGCACACAEPGGLRVEGPAVSPSPRTRPVFVADMSGHPAQRPAVLRLTERVTLSQLRWRSWGGDSAEAVGSAGGDWCLPDCRERPQPVKLRLSGMVRQERLGYYTRAGVVSDAVAGLPPELAGELRDVRLRIPRL